jgi:hypothetical protein
MISMVALVSTTLSGVIAIPGKEVNDIKGF